MISNKKEIMLAFKGLGWKTGRDSVGDSTCQYMLEDRNLHAMPVFRKLSNKIVFAVDASVSTAPFSKAESEIYGEKNNHAPIIISEYRDFAIEKPEITLEDVRTLSDNMIAWAKAQNIELGLKKYRELSTDAKGALPVRHLAALALRGDLKKLKQYQAAFEKGDRLGFVPYITLEMIERAVKIAEENYSPSESNFLNRLLGK